MKQSQFYYINALENALLFATNTNGDEVKAIYNEAKSAGFNASKLYAIAKARAFRCLCSE